MCSYIAYSSLWKTMTKLKQSIPVEKLEYLLSLGLSLQNIFHNGLFSHMSLCSIETQEFKYATEHSFSQSEDLSLTG